jgi:signal transduction histidine kinase
VVSATDGREALDVLASDAVDLILCDLVMPVMGAFEVLEKVRECYPNVPLVVITGHGTVATAVEAMKSGAYDFITKPFRADHLILIIRRALEKQDLERRTRVLQEAQARNLYDLTMEKSRIRTIINCMADGVLVTNRDLEVVLHNTALRRLFELTTPFTEPWILRDGLTDDDLIDGLRSLLDPGNMQPGVIVREFRKGDMYIHAISAPVPGPHESVVGTVTVFRDVTIFKELDEMKSSFVQMVSHELRSPLASIKQIVSVLLEGLAGELLDKQKELLNRSHMKIEGLLALINDLLDIARIESRQGFQQHVPVELGEVLEHAVELIRPRSDEHKVQLRLVIAGKLPIIQADPASMEELFTNLITNAVNYSPDGGEVVVFATTTGNFLDVYVSDTGVGMAPEEASKIFEKFYRIKHPKTRHVTGTGLGLALVKGIIESHRGSIEVDSRSGMGTTFRVLLPTIH